MGEGLFTKTGLDLSTAGIISSSFVPNGPAQWREETVNINSVSYNNRPSVRFKFEYLQQTGNNIYIDDINVTGTSTVGIQDIDFLTSVSLYPNPAAGAATLSYNLGSASEVTIYVSDIAGRKVHSVISGKQAAGSYDYRVGEGMPAGVYFVNFMIDGGRMTEKLILTR
jgi:hypothetical protein